MTALRLSVRHVLHAPVRPDLPYREEHFGHTSIQVDVPPEEAALVLVDCWDVHVMVSHLERTAQICRERIRPVMEACRRIGFAVVHAPSPRVARKFPQWLRYAGDSEVSPTEVPPAWPPAEFVQRKGEWARLRPQRSPVWAAEIQRINQARYVDASVLPEADDEVVASGEQLHRLCTHRRIRYLFYAGFATNICVPNRDYGLRAMRARGYYLVLLRDCTTGIETADTLPDLAVTKAVIHDYELNDVAGSITSDAFFTAAAALTSPG